MGMYYEGKWSTGMPADYGWRLKREMHYRTCPNMSAFIFKISHKLDTIYGINQKDENHILDILRLGKGQYRSNLLFALY